MSDSIIQVENLGKKYQLRHQSNERYTALRDVVTSKVRKFLRPPAEREPASPQEEDFWALKDISFEVKRGEVLGIIGRNGAGKSTLLKILSRITEPTTGRVSLGGRVASLLEVGTGFHPELTGRENVFLNGAIMGMTKAEIRSKFDEIVSFAEVSRFLDTPVKRYSSGMYVRLAFAVAAHLEPEILVIDEVLAVGDAQFQRKCLGKMQEVSRGGRTVLFVSHQMAAVENLCQSAILMSNGRLVQRGPATSIIASYVAECASSATISLADRKDRRGNGRLRFVQIRICDPQGNDLPAMTCGEDSVLEIKFKNVAGEALPNLDVSIGVENSMGQRITTWSTSYTGDDHTTTPASDFFARIHLRRISLLPGTYTLYTFATVNGDVADWLLPATVINVEPGDFYGTGKLPETRDGAIASEHRFTFSADDETA